MTKVFCTFNFWQRISLYLLEWNWKAIRSQRLSNFQYLMMISPLFPSLCSPSTLGESMWLIRLIKRVELWGYVGSYWKKEELQKTANWRSRKSFHVLRKWKCRDFHLDTVLFYYKVFILSIDLSVFFSSLFFGSTCLRMKIYSEWRYLVFWVVGVVRIFWDFFDWMWDLDIFLKIWRLICQSSYFF